MREHLYRGKTTKKILGGEFDEVWVYGDLVHSGEKIYIHPQSNSFQVDGELSNLVIMHEVNPETVGEFTGLTDKNGKKIFEGDVCTDGQDIYEIIFDRFEFEVKVIKSSCCLVHKGYTFPLWHFDNCEKNGYRQLEVIGNIHDNSELLK